jgi:hypothetical protein
MFFYGGRRPLLGTSKFNGIAEELESEIHSLCGFYWILSPHHYDQASQQVHKKCTECAQSIGSPPKSHLLV